MMADTVDKKIGDYGALRESVPMDDIEAQNGAAEQRNPVLSTGTVENPFNETFDTSFWMQVPLELKEKNKKRKKLNKGREREEKVPLITRNEIEIRLRLKQLEETFKKSNTNEDYHFLTYLLVEHHDSYMETIKHENVTELKDSYLKQLSDFAIILLKEDYYQKNWFDIIVEDDDDDDDDDDTGNEKKPERKENTKVRKYDGLIMLPATSSENKIRQSYVLHLAAKRNLCDIARYFLHLYPETISKSDVPRINGIPLDDRLDARLAVEIALDYRNDDVCAILMKSMTNKRVRELFCADDVNKKGKCFNKIIKHSDMKQTVLCALDACINPNFPYLREDDAEKERLAERGEELWGKIPDIPLQYNFHFRLLDSDAFGRPPTSEKHDHHNSSPLQVIANEARIKGGNDDDDDEQNLEKGTSKDVDVKNQIQKNPVLHPTVRLLVREKWNEYGFQTVLIYLVMFLFFLVNLSIATILGAQSKSLMDYSSDVDKLRAFCEIITLLFTLYYALAELEEFIKDPTIYASNWFNVLDIIGIISIIMVLPCRFYEARTTSLSIYVIAYFSNFFRVFKFSVILPKELGVYVKTFFVILKTDIKKFAVVFLVVMMAFTGSVYIALIASKSLDDDFRNFLDVLLQELRALMEGKEFADSYAEKSYSVVLTLFVLLNMATVIVIFSNILIAQLSYRYETAQAAADLQYDIDRTECVTNYEKSWFSCQYLNNRTKCYNPGIFISQKEMDTNLLVYWNKQTSQEDEKKAAIQSMLEKKILKRK